MRVIDIIKNPIMFAVLKVGDVFVNESDEIAYMKVETVKLEGMWEKVNSVQLYTGALVWTEFSAAVTPVDSLKLQRVL